ncbi:MAG: C39 family peptidase [Actinobacteria bacterium]|nr:C39 family peptidase [Actinomycetota bacterium]
MTKSSQTSFVLVIVVAIYIAYLSAGYAAQTARIELTDTPTETIAVDVGMTSAMVSVLQSTSDDFLLEEESPVASSADPAETEAAPIVYEKPLSILIDVPYVSESYEYPTACESMGAVMLLQYYGIDITLDSFVENHLPIAYLDEIDGRLYAPHPNQAFIGDPQSESGFGCYAPVIIDAFRDIVPSDTYVIQNETGASLPDVVDRYVARGTPVLVWATIYMIPSTEGPSWYVSGTDEIYTWLYNEHCLVLVGYDESYYYFNDPYYDSGIMAYEKALAEKRYDELGRQAVAVFATQVDLTTTSR